MDIWYTKQEAHKLAIEDKLREEFSRLYSKIYTDISKIEMEYDKRFISEDISSYVIEDKCIIILNMPYTILKPLFGISRILCDKYKVQDVTTIRWGMESYKIPSAEVNKVLEIIHSTDSIISATNYESNLTGKYLTDGTHFDYTRAEYVNRINTGLNPLVYSPPKLYMQNTIEYIENLIARNGIKYLPEELVKVVETDNSVQVVGNNYKFIYDVWIKLVYYHYRTNSQVDSIRCVYDGIESYIPRIIVSDFKLLCKLFNKLVSETDYVADKMQYTVIPDFNDLRLQASANSDKKETVGGKAKSVLSSFFKL